MMVYMLEKKYVNQDMNIELTYIEDKQGLRLFPFNLLSFLYKFSFFFVYNIYIYIYIYIYIEYIHTQ